MKKGLASLRESKLMKNIVTVVSGNSLAQVIILLFSPIITRVYSPEVFGVQGVFLAAVSLLAPVVALRFPMAIVMAQDESDIREIEKISLITALLTSLLTLLALVLFHHHISIWLGLDEIGPLIFLLPLALFLTGVQEITNYNASRKERFKAISVVAAVQALIVNSVRVIGGLIAPIASILILISSIAPGIHATMLSSSKHRDKKESKSWVIDKSKLSRTAKKYWDFPAFRMPTDLLNAASQTSPVILLSLYFGPVVAGLFVLTKSALTMPSNVIGNAIGTVFYSHYAEKARQRRSLTASVARNSLVLILGPGLLVIIASYFGPTIFAVFFGEEWREAGVYAQWLSLATAFSLAHVPAVRVAPIIRKQGYLLVINIIFLLTRAGALLIAAEIYGTAQAAVIAFSLTSALGSLGLILTMLVLAKRFDSHLQDLDNQDDHPRNE